MTKFLKTLFVLAMLPMAAMLTGCNDDAGKGTIDEYYQAFATLKAIQATGSSFEVQKDFDSDPVIFTTTRRIDPNIYSEGNRYIIAYMTSDGKPFTPGPIELYNIFGLYQADVEYGTQQIITNGFSDPYTSDITITGNFINVALMAPANNNPRLFMAYMLDSSARADYPDIYICFRTDNDLGPQQTYFGTFDYSKLLIGKEAKGITVHYKVNGVEKTRTVTIPTLGEAPTLE